MLFSVYGKSINVEEISKSVPQVKNEKDEDFGTINQQMATYCIELGFEVSMYTFDCQIIDQSWKDFSADKIIERLEASKDGWEAPGLGSLWSNGYRQAYIGFVKAGGNLQIRPYVTSSLIYELLKKGPVLPCLCFNTLYGSGRTSHFDDTSEAFDDVNGRTWNHSVVIYGNNEQGEFLVADPWKRPGLQIINPEAIIAAISTAQIECDNALFQITPK